MLNIVVLIGRTTKDLELRYTTVNDIPVTNMTVAVNRIKKKGTDQSEADFIPVIVFGETAKNCVKYIGKGSLIGVQGRLQVRTYDDNDGKRHWRTEVLASLVDFLNLKKPGEGSAYDQNEIPEIADEDVPY